jgi:phosphatidylinositol-3-phosphatase
VSGLLALVLMALSGIFGAAAVARPAPASAAPPPIRHVFLIVLENESASVTFGPDSPAPYLSKTLTAEGAFLPNYYGIGHESNDNYIAMISGQAPNVQNQDDCQTFENFLPGTIGAHGQVQGSGCVYPAGVQTIASQLTPAGFTWRDYNEDMGAGPTRESAVCGHPAVGSIDNTQQATATDMYATRHNPFVYFHSIIDDSTLCDTHVVNLDALPQDLANPSATANYTFITPDLCDDGHNSPCADGEPGGLAQADKFLQRWVPQITGSPAFRQNGLLIITFDEAATSDTSSCCGEIPGPGSPEPGINGPGGGVVGAVLLSPCIAPRTVSETPYNHYAMLGSVENILGLSHLGYAALPGEAYFGPDIFNRSCGAAPPVVKIHAPPIASSVSASARVRISWSSTTTGGTSLASYTIEVRDLSLRHGAWRTLSTGTQTTSHGFTGALGDTYEFRVQAVNLAGQASDWASATTIIPSGVRVAQGHFSRHWTIHRQRGAWQQREIQSSTPGAGFTLRYVGGALTLIGERTAHGDVMRVTLDGRAGTVHLHSGRLNRRRVIYTKDVRPGVHHVKIVVVRGVVELEGIAIASRTG